MEKKLPIIVCAGNREQYEMYLASHGLHSGNAVYANAHILAGVEASEIIVIGTFWERPDAGEAFEYAKSRIMK